MKRIVTFLTVMVCFFAHYKLQGLDPSYYERLVQSSKNILQKYYDHKKVVMNHIQSFQYEKIEQEVKNLLQDTAEPVEIIDPVVKKSSDNARKSIHMNKSGLFGKAESVVVENVQINHYGSKSFSECFFQWLKTCGQKRIVCISMVIGFAGGYITGVCQHK